MRMAIKAKPSPLSDPEQELALLRRFEPVIRFTRGEHFFPCDVDDYVAHCSLWRQLPGREAECLIPAEQLTLETLGTFSTIDQSASREEAVYFLKFVDPLNVVEMASHNRQQRQTDKQTENLFRPGPGRLARVGYFSRLVDAAFSLALLARGRVSGDTSAAASIVYAQTHAQRPEYRYHGRVVRQGDWLVLQYWFFYYFNNWRSGFFGANDHEADWEMICIYLSQDEPAGDVTPEWVAYASHDYAGDDLRRHWDDPELERVGEHPVIYAGAGSHASYYTAGEYVTELTLPFLRPIVRLANRLKHIWRTRFRQYTHINENDDMLEQEGEGFSIFQIPFVDYARGDGLSIGADTDRSWAEPVLLNETASPWAINYRGLWGLYTQDPFSGEDAPAGPMYDRDGSMRRSWYDPVGWSGLDKVPPSNKALAVIEEQVHRLEAEQTRLREDTAVKNELLRGLGVEVQAVSSYRDMSNLAREYEEELNSLTNELNQLRERTAHNEMVLRALGEQINRLQRGERPPLRAHIKRAHRPTTSAEIKISRVTEVWAAISIAVLLIGIVLLLFFARDFILVGMIALTFTVSLIEATFRRRLINFLNNTAVLLAIVASLILFYEFLLQWLVISVVLAGLYILIINIRELRA